MIKEKIRILFFVLAFVPFVLKSQQSDSVASPQWHHGGEIMLYFIPDNFIFLPIYSVDHGWLHLEARYNYEDMNTFSAWFGYTFSGGKKFMYDLTPMIGGVVGNTNGIAGGLEFTLSFRGLTFYSESEYVFSLNDVEEDYFYSWNDFTYTPIDWLWFGISFQRTKLYHTKQDIQPGLTLGGGYKWFGVSGYFFNPGLDDPYFVLSFTLNFPAE